MRAAESSQSILGAQIARYRVGEAVRGPPCWCECSGSEKDESKGLAGGARSTTISRGAPHSAGNQEIKVEAVLLSGKKAVRKRVEAAGE